MKPLIQSLRLGQVPRVVGTIITEDFLRDWSARRGKLPCDLVELRIDGFPDFNGWLQIGAEIEEFELPVFATIRLAKEGGEWTRPDSDRWPLLEEALHSLSGVDVEIESELSPLAAKLAADLGKLCVLSHHDFQGTPPLSRMIQLLERAHQHGAIGKIAAAANSPEDVTNLHSVLKHPWAQPVCLIGMGPFGRPTRLTFPLEGSCFTYGYLDAPGAPGQFSAAELTEHFTRAAP